MCLEPGACRRRSDHHLERNVASGTWKILKPNDRVEAHGPHSLRHCCFFCARTIASRMFNLNHHVCSTSSITHVQPQASRMLNRIPLNVEPTLHAHTHTHTQSQSHSHSHARSLACMHTCTCDLTNITRPPTQGLNHSTFRFWRLEITRQYLNGRCGPSRV